MTNLKTTKRALFSSVIALLVCFTMLIGTTFAWFTDSVTSANNIIKSGNLDVEMFWAEGTEDPATAAWEDASETAIFDYDNWEPGYVDVKHVQIKNNGTLALKYQVKIMANGEVSDLSDVIDVYYVDPAQAITNRAQLTADNYLGTLPRFLPVLTPPLPVSLRQKKHIPSLLHSRCRRAQVISIRTSLLELISL